MTKEEVIKEAYRGYWDLLTQEQQEKVIVNNGWVNCSVLSLVNRIEYCQSKSHSYFSVAFSHRPALLEGIENNNGWTKIESEEDLPKEDVMYRLGFFISSGKFYQDSNPYSLKTALCALKESYYTHYQQISEFKSPIF